MSEMNGVYKSKIYQVIYSFGGLSYDGGVFASVLLLNVLGGLFITFLALIFTNDPGNGRFVVGFINMVVLWSVITFLRLPTRCLDDSINTLRTKEKESFGTVKTDKTMRYWLFHFLYIDVYKSLALAFFGKIIITGLLTYGMYVFWYALLPHGGWFLVYPVANILYLPFVLDDN